MRPAAGRKEMLARFSPPAASTMDSSGRRSRRRALDMRTSVKERLCRCCSSSDPALASKPKVAT